jgi:predicted negative regulator of RcsB-dependent stress response
VISDIKEIISNFKEILKHNLKNVVILLLVLSLLFLGWEHLNAAKTFNTKEAQYKAMCDSLLLVEKKLRFETELAYNKSLADIRDKNKEEIITYYRDIISNFRTSSHAQKSLR